jgi:hypothetical protein
MMNWITIGVGAGLVAGALHAAILAPTPTAALLFYASPLPLFLAGLGWGTWAAALAAIVGSLFTALVSGLAPAVMFLGTVAAAPAILSWFALKSRPSSGTASEGEIEAAGLQWYPEGRLVLWTAAGAALVTAAAILLVSHDIEAFRANAAALIKRMLAAMSQGLPPSEAERLDRIIAYMVAALPLAAASLWLLAMLANLRIAAGLLSALGLGLRPWSRFGALTFPRRAAIVLPVSIGLAFLPEPLGFIGSLFAAAMFTAFALLGLAVLHGLTEGVALRGVLLAGLYVALVLLNWVLVVPFAALGLIDMAFAMRARSAATPHGT